MMNLNDLNSERVHTAVSWELAWTDPETPVGHITDAVLGAITRELSEYSERSQIISTGGERPTSQPPVTIDLPAGMPQPSVLRLAASELRHGPLGVDGKPRSLPGTLDALADAIEDALGEVE